MKVHCTLLSRSQPLWSILIKQMFSGKVIAPIVVTGLGKSLAGGEFQIAASGLAV